MEERTIKDINNLLTQLFQKMKEAGYEWDAEKKELKLLITNGGDFEPKQEWNEEDERNLNGIIDKIQANKSNAPSYDIKTYDRFLNWLKSLKERITWKPSEEQLDELVNVITEFTTGEQFKQLNSLYEQLIKL